MERCGGCTASVAPGHAYCSQCGRMCRPPPKVRRLAYANAALAPIGMLGGAGLGTWLHHYGQVNPSYGFLAFIGLLYALIGMAVLAPLLFVAAWGMLKGRPWGLRLARVIWAAGAVFMTLSVWGILLGITSGLLWVAHHDPGVRAWFDPRFWASPRHGTG